MPMALGRSFLCPLFGVHKISDASFQRRCVVFVQSDQSGGLLVSFQAATQTRKRGSAQTDEFILFMNAMNAMFMIMNFEFTRWQWPLIVRKGNPKMTPVARQVVLLTHEQQV